MTFLVEIARWRFRWQSLPSPTASCWSYPRRGAVGLSPSVLETCLFWSQKVKGRGNEAMVTERDIAASCVRKTRGVFPAATPRRTSHASDFGFSQRHSQQTDRPFFRPCSFFAVSARKKTLPAWGMALLCVLASAVMSPWFLYAGTAKRGVGLFLHVGYSVVERHVIERNAHLRLNSEVMLHKLTDLLRHSVTSYHNQVGQSHWVITSAVFSHTRLIRSETRSLGRD